MAVLPLLLALLGHLVTSTSAQTGPKCINREIRTVQENGFDIFQYCVQEEWRMLCIDYTGPWRAQEASVVCRQLGYGGVHEGSDQQRRFTSSNPTDKFFRFPAQCNGNETSVYQCGGDVVELDGCSSGFQGVAACYSDCSPGEIRLANGLTHREGRVEICIGGRWRTVCYNQDGLTEAVCAQLGFLAEGAELTHTFGPGLVPISTCVVQDGLLNCTEVTDTSCDHTMDLGVMCKSCQDTQDQIGMTADSEKPATRTCSDGNEGSSQSVNATTPALGAVIGLLVVISLIAVLGWIVTCIKLSRAVSGPHRKNTAGVCTCRNESYSLQKGPHNEVTQANHSSLGPHYDQDLTTYDVLNHNQPPPAQPRPSNPTPQGASNKQDDFYDAEEHTYAMVNKKKGKKKEREDQRGNGTAAASEEQEM